MVLMKRRRQLSWMAGVFCALCYGAPDVYADTKPAPPSPVTSSFEPPLREMRAALREVSEHRKAAQQRGDKLKEACLYERQRAIAQAVDSTEVAAVSFEAANKLGEAGKAQAEIARAEKAVELVRTLRTAAEACIGEELRGTSKPSTVTVNGPGKLDDPQAGPSEAARANVVRLELPSRPNPASAFRQPR